MPTACASAFPTIAEMCRQVGLDIAVDPHSGRSRRALPDGRCRDRRVGPHVVARAVCRRGNRLHRRAWREPAREQLAAGRTGVRRPRRRSDATAARWRAPFRAADGWKMASARAFRGSGPWRQSQAAESRSLHADRGDSRPDVARRRSVSHARWSERAVVHDSIAATSASRDRAWDRTTSDAEDGGVSIC